jgi:hypothetical protein
MNEKALDIDFPLYPGLNGWQLLLRLSVHNSCQDLDGLKLN